MSVVTLLLLSCTAHAFFYLADLIIGFSPVFNASSIDDDPGETLADINLYFLTASRHGSFLTLFFVILNVSFNISCPTICNAD